VAVQRLWCMQAASVDWNLRQMLQPAAEHLQQLGLQYGWVHMKQLLAGLRTQSIALSMHLHAWIHPKPQGACMRQPRAAPVVGSCAAAGC
jgi:hypothetical protein